MPPTLGTRVSPRSWLGLCMEEAAGHGFLSSSSPGGQLERGGVAGIPSRYGWEGLCPPVRPFPAWGAAACWGRVSSGTARVLDGVELGTLPAARDAAPGSVPDLSGLGAAQVWLGEEGAGRAAEKPLGSLANGLSLICKSLLGRNQPHENAISTQSLFWPLSCFRQKQFTLPVIKQG